jgi:short-subunit dehydrogenase involved in D-alanine esterification of teichoic acids
MFEEFIVENYGGVDIIVNNAAVNFGKDKVPVSRQAQLCLEVDFTGTLNMCKIFLPHLRPRARSVNLTNGYLAKKDCGFALVRHSTCKIYISTKLFTQLTDDCQANATICSGYYGNFPHTVIFCNIYILLNQCLLY